jgi:hypothetical protein
MTLRAAQTAIKDAALACWIGSPEDPHAMLRIDSLAGPQVTVHVQRHEHHGVVVTGAAEAVIPAFLAAPGC